jgi:predicted permease
VPGSGRSSKDANSLIAGQKDWTAVRRAYFQQVLARTKALPGVRDAAFINVLPFGDAPFAGFPISIAGKAAPSLPRFEWYVVVSPDYFGTMGIPLRSGRFFTDGDGAGSPNVAIINQTMARLCWPGANPVGKFFTTPLAKDAPFQVVGVVGDVPIFGLSSNPVPEMYYSIYQQVQNSAYLVIRTAQSPGTLAPAVRAAVRSVDELEPISSFSTMHELISRSVAQPRFRTVLLGIFAALALLLATAGIYGVISYSTAQRQHEFAVRMALGAQKKDIIRLVIRHGLSIIVVGMGVGMLGAFGLGRLLAHELYGVKPADPETLILVALLMAATALSACYIPARRATKGNPMSALKYE